MPLITLKHKKWEGIHEDLYSPHVLDCFVTKEQAKIWNEDFDSDDDELITWYNDYEQPKEWKKSIKEELLPTAWHL